MTEGYEKFITPKKLRDGPYCAVNDDYASTADVFAIDGSLFDQLWLYRPISGRPNHITILGQESYRQLILSGGYIGQPPVPTHEYISTEIPANLLFSFPWQTSKFRSASFETMRDTIMTQSPLQWSDQVCHALGLMGVQMDYTQKLTMLLEYGPRGMHELLEFNQQPLRITNATSGDISRFIHKYSKHVVSRMWYEVDPLDVPGFEDLPIYTNGSEITVHISFLELMDWIQWKLHQHYCIAQTAIYTRGWPDDRVEELVMRAQKAINDIMASTRSAKAADADTIDIEDLGRIREIMPPCVHKMLEKRQFPVDGDRTMLVPIMKRGNLSLETVRRFLESLNTDDISLKRRFDYVNYYKYDKKVSCQDMAQYCPFAATETPTAPRTLQCHEHFIASNPDVPVNKEEDSIAFCGKYTGGPHNLVVWKLR